MTLASLTFGSTKEAGGLVGSVAGVQVKEVPEVGHSREGGEEGKEDRLTAVQGKAASSDSLLLTTED